MISLAVTLGSLLLYVGAVGVAFGAPAAVCALLGYVAAVAFILVAR